MKIGSKIAARYKASTGEVKDEAIMEFGCGSLALWCFASELEIHY